MREHGVHGEGEKGKPNAGTVRAGSEFMVVTVANEHEEQQRQQLLANLFGQEVPSGLNSQLLRTADVASLFHVSERTISDWARRGRIPSVQTPGGHRRYPAAEIRRIMEEADWADIAPEARHLGA